jgi:hypothetical protein
MTKKNAEQESFRCVCGHRAIDHPDPRPEQLQTFPCSWRPCDCKRFVEQKRVER